MCFSPLSVLSYFSVPVGGIQPQVKLFLLRCKSLKMGHKDIFFRFKDKKKPPYKLGCVVISEMLPK